ncbi:hypothetical protein [Mycobacterium decipiens]|uniref:MbtH family protein n=1 Tax=Mycobacterium decipiens TaxID=1430326 RepID=A0A1X2LP07_9MYCO|nr:hypothetical protein [Mycobacterium decipiens]OSC36487.1 hypothetical protein B8W66_22910 [Mycobacterium decipiens]
MSINPFDDDSRFLGLLNKEEQHIPGEPARAGCLDYIERNWADIRPQRLREKLAQHRACDA